MQGYHDIAAVILPEQSHGPDVSPIVYVAFDIFCGQRYRFVVAIGCNDEISICEQRNGQTADLESYIAVKQYKRFMQCVGLPAKAATMPASPGPQPSSTMIVSLN